MTIYEIRQTLDQRTTKAIFNYPPAFTSLAEYTEHRGQTVEIIRELSPYNEYDYEGEIMFEIRASDGWRGHAFESELERIKDNA